VEVVACDPDIEVSIEPGRLAFDCCWHCIKPAMGDQVDGLFRLRPRLREEIGEERLRSILFGKVDDLR